jgi:hypothetical protein
VSQDLQNGLLSFKTDPFQLGFIVMELFSGYRGSSIADAQAAFDRVFPSVVPAESASAHSLLKSKFGNIVRSIMSNSLTAKDVMAVRSCLIRI